MFKVVLWQPEIPPNTGNIIRLCANTGSELHLLEPLGFDLDDRLLKRAGLDYREYASVQVHSSLEDYVKTTGAESLFAFSTKGTGNFANTHFPAACSLLFGPETRGLPQTLLDELPPDQVVRLPMLAHSRSLNLSNAVAIAVFEAWRQHQYTGAR